MNAAMAKLGSWFMPNGRLNWTAILAVVCIMLIALNVYFFENHNKIKEHDKQKNASGGTGLDYSPSNSIIPDTSSLANESAQPDNNAAQAQTNPPFPIPIGTSNEPLWSEHNDRLLSLEAGMAALKQEISQLKAQAGQCQAQVESLKQEPKQQSVPTPPTVAVKSSQSAVKHSPVKRYQPTRKITVKHALVRKSHLKRPKRPKHPKRRQSHPAAVRNKYQFNTPLVVEAVNSWGGETRVVVRDPKSRQLKHLRIGDDLGGYTIDGTQGRDVALHNSEGRFILKMPEAGSRR